jgi:hypothetical protein
MTEEKRAETEQKISDKLQRAADVGAEVLLNEMTGSGDPKIRIAAATAALDRAGHGPKGKETGGPGVVVNLNFDKLSDGLREMRKVGFGGTVQNNDTRQLVSGE